MLPPDYLTLLRELPVTIAVAEAALSKSESEQSKTVMAVHRSVNSVVLGSLDSIEILKSGSHWADVVEALKAAVSSELSWAEWWISIPERDQDRIIGFVEIHLAAIPDVVDPIVAAKALRLSDEEFKAIQDKVGTRIRSPGFRSWMMAAEVLNITSGYVRLAMACSELWKVNEFARDHGVKYAGESGDPSRLGAVWDRQGRRWDWIKARGSSSGFSSVASELKKLKCKDADDIAFALRQATSDPPTAALRIALHCNEEQSAEVREDLSCIPITKLPATLTRSSDNTIFCAAVLEDGTIATAGRTGKVLIWGAPVPGQVPSVTHSLQVTTEELESENSYGGDDTAIWAIVGIKGGGFAVVNHESNLDVWHQKSPGSWGKLYSVSFADVMPEMVAVMPDGVTLVAGTSAQVDIVNGESGAVTQSIPNTPGFRMAVVDDDNIYVGGYGSLAKLNVRTGSKDSSKTLPEREASKFWVSSFVTFDGGDQVLWGKWGHDMITYDFRNTDLGVRFHVSAHMMVDAVVDTDRVIAHEKWGKSVELWSIKSRSQVWASGEFLAPIEHIIWDASKSHAIVVFRTGPWVVIEVPLE